ncbi:MAG: toll/interleukin-1 receptor domain-containing protein [Chloroflexota bacterium]|nr:toll/interleukin-1 receptor domain-containing protein [Chloroflexota bacterium]
MSSELDKFLEERYKIPIPSGDAAWVKMLAKELAIGANRNLWSPRRILDYSHGGASALDNNAKAYFERRWHDNDLEHLLEILLGHEYLFKQSNRHFPELAAKAYELLDDVEPYSIFISYRRLDSSALALLVLARLKEHGLVPFIDMALEAGGVWHADLEEQIKATDYFIILLGKETLSSPMTVKEIQWAIKYKKTIIPLWHSRFNLNDEQWPNIPTPVRDAVQQTNAIIVQNESASGYNSAIVELLNRFGVTP